MKEKLFALPKVTFEILIALIIRTRDYLLKYFDNQNKQFVILHLINDKSNDKILVPYSLKYPCFYSHAHYLYVYWIVLILVYLFQFTYFIKTRTKNS